MIYSTDRILTTHAGSLPRPDELVRMVTAKSRGEPYDRDALDALLPGAVADVVRRQVDCGIDCVNEGEFGKVNFTNYVRERIAGFELRDQPGKGFAHTPPDSRNFFVCLVHFRDGFYCCLRRLVFGQCGEDGIRASNSPAIWR